MKVYFLYHGSMHCDSRWIVGGNNFATRSDKSPPTIWYDCPTLTVSIDHPRMSRSSWNFVPAVPV